MVWLLIALLAAKPLPGESLGINFWKNLAVPRFMPRQGINFVFLKIKAVQNSPQMKSHGKVTASITPV